MIIEIKEDLLTEVVRFAWEFERQQETCSFPNVKILVTFMNDFLNR